MEVLNKYGWLFILIAMIGDIVVSLFLSFFYKGYSNTRMTISALGNPSSPVRLPFNIWMVLEGVLFLAAIPAIYSCYSSISGGMTKVLVVFIAIFAVGACIFTGFFSVNESKDIVTTASKIHGIGAISIACFVISLIFFVLFVMSDKPEFKDTIIQNEGLWERLNLIFMYLPLMIVSIKHMTETGK